MKSAADVKDTIASFMADRNLMELCELQKTSDEVLEVIRLSENQHSAVLAWMLDAKEGHGQGDEILRDLLISASVETSRGGGLPDGRFKTAQFFNAWTPLRIRTTSFGAAFTVRELWLNSTERLDLVVIDMQNEFILIVENKTRGRQKKDQLHRYWAAFNELVANNPLLKGFEHAFIALDKGFDPDELKKSRAAAKYWLHLGYDWLKDSATRAEMHIKRGNAAAQLVVNYCNSQTDWENPETSKEMEIATRLQQDYPETVERLVGLSQGSFELNWLSNKSDPALVFLLQNKGVAALLRETQGMATVEAAIRRKLDDLPKDSVLRKRWVLDVCARGWQQFKGERTWPVLLRVRATRDPIPTYSLILRWEAREAADEKTAERLRSLLIKVDRRFGSYRGQVVRRVILKKNITLEDLVPALVDVEARMNKIGLQMDVS